jgi:hypothetical protein
MLEKVNNEHHNWDICGEFKMLGFLGGLQGGHTKYWCFLCLWNSSAADQHYVQSKWPARKQRLPGTCNVIHEALVQTDKILQLHVKSAPVKQYVETLGHTSGTLQHVMFCVPSDASNKSDKWHICCIKI